MWKKIEESSTQVSLDIVLPCIVSWAPAAVFQVFKFWFAEMLVPTVSCWAVHCVAEDILLHLLASQLSLLNLNFPLKEQKWIHISIRDNSFPTYERSVHINQYCNKLLPSVLLLNILTAFQWGKLFLYLISFIDERVGSTKGWLNSELCLHKQVMYFLLDSTEEP